MSEGSDDVFGLGADAVFAAPDADAAADVVTGGLSLPWPEGAFVDGIGNPGDGPYLAVVGVSAELEVDAAELCLFEVVWLVVEQDGVVVLWRCCYELREWETVGVGAVVTSDDAECAVDEDAVVDEHVDACVAEETACEGLLGIVFVVAEAGIY